MIRPTLFRRSRPPTVFRKSHPDPTAEQLAHAALFAHARPTELAELARHADRIRVAPGRRVVTEGRTPHAVYVVVRGRLTVTAGDHFVAELGPGDHLGDVSVMTGQPMAVTVTATTDGEVLEIGQRAFLGAVASQPIVTRRILREVAAGSRQIAAAA